MTFDKNMRHVVNQFYFCILIYKQSLSLNLGMFRFGIYKIKFLKSLRDIKFN